MRIRNAFLLCAAVPTAILAQNWTQQSPAIVPPARDGSAMVYDSVHHQTILFGGEDSSSTALNDTWLYNGTAWTQMHPTNSPPARLWHAMAFNSATGQVILFGGCSSSASPLSYLGDTWLWDGSNWTQAASALSPSARQAPAMAFDASTGQTVLFGGANTVPGALTDTWIWNGSSWSSPSTAAVPARRFASMSYDSTRNEIVMFGGDNGTATRNDTWVWQGTDWTQMNPASSPSARSSQGQAYDTARQLTVLFGGGSANDTWLWNGSNWSQETTLASPPARFYVNMAYDFQHANMVLFGGASASASGDLNDTWKLGYTYTENWMEVTAPGFQTTVVGPSARTNAAATAEYSDVLVFGGSDGTNVYNDVWLWFGNQWAVDTIGTPPPARQSAALVEDSTNGNAVLFGGNASATGSSPLGDTWLWNGFEWTDVTTSSDPSAREGHAMANSPANSGAVMFGGFTGSYIDDTWTWNGSSWTQQDPTNYPSSRAYHSMVYDVARSQVVLFGGFNGAYLNDTWTWDGLNWTQQSPATVPPARANYSLVYDSVHGTVQMFGGQNSSGALNDTWIWDGVNWTQFTPVTSPTARYGMASAYLATAGQSFIYGGSNGSSDLQEGWALGSPAVNVTLPVGYWGESYSYTIVPTGGVAPYTFTETGNPFTFGEFGFTFNTSTGAISGTDGFTPGEVVAFGMTIRDAQGQSTTVSFELNTDTAITFSPGPLPDATAGTNYNVPLSASGGTPPYTFNSSGLPTGLSISGSAIVGLCSGSSSGVTLSVTDSIGGTASAGPYTLNCNPAPYIITSSPLPNGRVGTFYSVQFSTNAIVDSPGAAPYIWSVTTPPAGLTMGATDGVLSGLPTAAGTINFSVTFTDRWGATTTQPFQVTITNAFSIATTQLALGNIGMAYPAGQQVAATGGVPAYHFSATGMPPGLGINATTGAITGTPTTAGTYNASFTVTDSTSAQAQAVIPIYVAAAGTNTEDWVQQFPASLPSGRTQAATFYDSVNGLTYLFGGTSAGSVLYETDSWNGTGWTTLSPANSPSARSGAAAAFDPVHGQGVLFGGQDRFGNPLGDTWLWNGTTWTQANPANVPAARFSAMMAWDGQEIVMFGGSLGDGDWSDTWIWTGTNWTQVPSPEAGPSARRAAGFSFDSVLNQVVLFGGYSIGSNSDNADTWIWSATLQSWTQASPANSPQARDSFAMVFDSLQNHTVLFGGLNSPAQTLFSDTWVWNGTTWTQLSPPHNPGARYGYAMAYDPSSSQVLLFGGSNTLLSSATLNDTWIFGGPVLTTTTLPSGAVSVPYSATITLQDPFSPFTYLYSTLPPGITFNTATGAFGGTPTSGGTYSVPISIQDSFGASLAPAFSLTISGPSIPLSLAPTTLPNATSGTNYLEQLSANGGISPYLFSATGLPAGLTFNSSNQIVGKCTASSTNVMLTVTDSETPVPGQVSVGPLSVTCNAAPLITTASPLADGIVNTPYSATIQMSGGTAPIGWSLTPGTLPSGFGLSSTGVLTGTATAPVSAAFSVTVTDLWGAYATQSFVLNLESVLTITSTSLPTGVQGSAYPSGTLLAVSGGTGSATYTFGATGLPNGLHIDPSTGAITGIPTQSGTFQPTFTVTDQTPQTAMKQITLAVLGNTGNPNWTNLNPSNPPGGRDGYAMAYDAVRGVTVLFGGSGLTDTWTFKFPSQWTQQSPTVSPQLDDGLAMAWMASQSNIVMFGGHITNTVLSDHTWVWDGTNWTLKSPATAPPARYGHAMAPDSGHQQALLFGGSSGGGYANALNDTYVWDGVNWTAKSPTNIPPAAFTPSLADGPTGPVLFGGLGTTGNPLGQTWVWDGSNWNLQSPVNSPSARSQAGMVYDSVSGVTILFGGFDGANLLQDTWRWDGHNWTQLNPSTVPAARDSIGLVYDSGFKQTIVFAGQSTAELDDTWTLGGPTVVNNSLPPAAAGASYSATIGVIGGTPPYSFSQTGNPQSLPIGLTLASGTGQITGATQEVGGYSVGISITDSQSLSTAPTFSLTVTPTSTLTLSPTSLPDATAQTAYTRQLSAVGGVSPYVFSATGLPGGLQFNSSNQIVGKCTADSTNVMLGVTDSALPTANSASVGPLTVHCNALPSITSPSPLPSGVAGTAYSAPLQMSGGTAPIAWSVTAGSTLPSGFSLSSGGVLTGPASTAVSTQFSLTVTDLWGATASKLFSLAIYPVLTIATASLPNGMAGTAYQTGVTIAASGGTGSGTYAFSATGLPTGFSVDSSAGTLSGTTSQTGLFTPTFKVTDQDTQIATKQIDLTILNGTGITILSPQTLPVGTSGQPYTYQLQWSGGVSPTAVSATGLPGWLTLNTTTGNLTGTPTAGGAYSFSIVLTDSQTPAPNIASQTETIVVNPPSITTTTPLPAATIGIAYSQNLTANGGTSPYTWTSASLPAWLSLSSSGALTGTPPLNTPSSVAFSVKATDSLGAFTIGNLTLPVLATPGLLFETTSPLPAGTPNIPYTTTAQVAGGNGLYTFGATGLPGWLTLNTATGALSGTPPSAGPVTFQLTVSDNVNQSFTEYFTLPVNAALTFATASPLPPATVGLPYSQTLGASGGSGSYTWSATGLPSWLGLSSSGVLSGTPTQAGAVSFRVTVQDTLNHAFSGTFTLQAYSALTINAASPLTPATLNFPYLATFAASGGGGGYQWSATGLPSGFSLSPAGVLWGTPQAAAPIVFSLTVKDALNNSLTQAMTLPVNAAVTIDTSSLPAATVAIPYSANFTASGGNPGYAWSATGLPKWLSLTAAGYLSGTPPTSAPVTFQVIVTDSASHSATSPFTLSVNSSLTITTATLPVATVNVSFTTALSATGGIGSYTWSATGLPAGVTLSPAGALSGSLSQAGPYSFQVTVNDSQSSVTSKSLTLLVSTGLPLSFVTQSLSPCVANAGCQSQIVAAGGIPPYTFSLASTANLDGLTLSPNGLLGGTPTAGGQIGIPVILTDQQTSISRTFTQTVYASIVVTTTSLSGGTVGVSYGTALSASGGQPPYSWSLYSGSLPPGLALDQQGGDIYGKPTAAGTYTFYVQVSDSQQTSPARQLSIAIASPPAPLTVTSPSQLPAGTVGTAYSQTLGASGGSGQYSWTLASGSLPAGLTLASTGAIAGTPTAAQTANFTATVNDTGGNSVTAGFSILVTGQTVALLTSSPLPNGVVGVLYSYGIQVTGGTPPYYYSISAGQVPPGLTFDSTNGTFTGTPTLRGSFGIVLNVSDSGGTGNGGQPASFTGKAAPRATTSATYTIQISGPGDYQIATGENLPNGTMGQSYSTTLTATGGTAPYRWQLLNGNLPQGLALSSVGQIAGTPTAAATASMVIEVVDNTGASATGAFLLEIVNANAPSINIFPPLPPGTVGVVYGRALLAAGGHSPYTWSLGGGALPPGLSLDAQGGIISGTPTAPGSFPFTVRVQDNNGVSATQNFTVRVNSATLAIAPASVPNATANIPYSFGLSVSGGTAPYTWSLSAGGLLAGFAIDPSSGEIGGTPTAPGSYQFTISVVDSNFGIGLQTYQLTVQTNGIGIVTSSLPTATVGSVYDFGLLASNAAAPLTWSVLSGTVPPGIQLLGASGQLAGTPTAAGSYTFTVQVTDATTAASQATFTLLVNPQPLTVITASLPGGAVGTAYSQTVQSAGGTGAITWSVAAGTLPAGLSLGAQTGTISGTPTAVGSFPFTVQATDSTGVTAQQRFSLNIAGPPPLPAITLAGLPAASKAGDQPSVTINLASAYPLPILVTATLTLTPNLGSSTDLMFSNGSRTIQITIPANTTQSTLTFQTGTLPGTIQLSLDLSAAGVDITPASPPSVTTAIAAAIPAISSVSVTTTSSGIQVTVVGTSTTLDMKTAAFHFTAAAGATLQTTDLSIDVGTLFAAWYQNPASLATGSQFSLTVPFTVGGNVSSIAAVSVTLTNSVGASAPAGANVP